MRRLHPPGAFDDIGRSEKRGYLDCECEGRIAGVLFPAVLTRDRAVADEVTCRPFDHRDEVILLGRGQMVPPPEHVGEEDRKGAFIHLHAAPVGLAVEPDVLRPVAVRLLNRHEVGESRFGLVYGARRDKGACSLD